MILSYIQLTIATALTFCIIFMNVPIVSYSANVGLLILSREWVSVIVLSMATLGFHTVPNMLKSENEQKESLEIWKTIIEGDESLYIRLLLVALWFAVTASTLMNDTVWWSQMDKMSSMPWFGDYETLHIQNHVASILQVGMMTSLIFQ